MNAVKVMNQTLEVVVASNLFEPVYGSAPDIYGKYDSNKVTNFVIYKFQELDC